MTQIKTKPTTVKLISSTANPLETIYAEWLQSRTADPVPTAAEIAYDIAEERSEVGFYTERTTEGDWRLNGTPGPLETKVIETFEKVVAMRMPLGEHLDFIFLLENCPVALREQLVRHRVGHKFGERIGADIVPDLAGNSSFWSQTTRIIDMGQFATNGDYYVSNWLKENGDKPVPKNAEAHDLLNLIADLRSHIETSGDINRHDWLARIDRVMKNVTVASDNLAVAGYYHRTMKWIEVAYRNLVAAGMPLEHARDILPVAMQHRMTWKANLSSLFHVMSRRSCWLAQLGYWEPVIEGIARELRKVHWVFGRMADPPCINAETGEFESCAFKKENEEIVGKGEYPPCTLWVHKHTRSETTTSRDHERVMINEKQQERFYKMKEKYTNLWRRDPVTGERLKLV